MSAQVPRTPDGAEEAGPGFRSRVGLALLLLFLPLLVYGRGIAYPWVRDDGPILARNPNVTDPGNVAGIWSSPYWPEETGKQDALYRPVPLTSFWLQQAIHGFSPAPLRAVNILLHGAVAVLLFLLLLDWAGRIGVAFFGGAWFALHGVHIEAVQYLVGRCDLLAGLGTLAVLWLHPRVGRKRGGLYGALAAVTLGLAFLSKESAVVLLPCLVLVDLWSRRTVRPEERRSWPWAMYGAYGAVAVLCFLLRGAVLGEVGPRSVEAIRLLDNPLAGVAFPERLLAALAIFAKLLRLMLVPRPVSCDYSLAAIPVPDGFDGAVVAGLLGLVALVVLAFLARRGKSVGWLLLGLFLVAWSLPSNVFLLIGTIFGLRLLYLPGAFLIALFAVSGAALLDRVDRNRSLPAGVAWGLGGAVLLGSAVLTFLNVGDWRDERTLIERSLAAEPRSARLNYLAGGLLAGSGNEAEAEPRLREAVAIDPDLHPARAMLGMILVRSGRLDEGVREIETVRAQDPAVVTPSFPYLAEALARKGKRAQAIRYLEAYLEANPGDERIRAALRQLRGG